MKRVAVLLFFVGLLFSGKQLLAYKIITPVPFSIANKNYLKIQLLAEQGDDKADSIFCDILFNSGNTLTSKLDISLSTILTLNQFNDGMLYLKARIYHSGQCDTLGSVYDDKGIPVLLDRHLASNETKFISEYISDAKNVEAAFRDAKSYPFSGNNNSLNFSSFWNEDSIFFQVKVKDAQLDYADPQSWDFFQAKKYLKVLWTSDCIELGFDLLHNRTEWKQADDYEFLADIKGNVVGNQWNIQDSMYNNWGKTVRLQIIESGTINNNLDTDSGYIMMIAIPWKAMKFKPKANESIGFDLQLYDKDGDYDEPFRSSLSGTNPESNDNTSEWTSLVLEKKSSFAASYLYWLLMVPIIGFGLYLVSVQRKKQPVPVATDIAIPETASPHYSESIHNAIQCIVDQYHDPELSRKQVADKVFLSEKYLSSLFKKEVGENLITYINKYRINHSVELLRHTKFSVSEIAFKVGYNSVQNFNKNFKNFMQQAPSEFRNERT